MVLLKISPKEAALARLRNVAVSFESGAVRSTLAVALAACLSSSRMKLRAATLGKMVKKERKKTDNPREGWEDGTPPPHRDFKERRVWC